MPISEADIKLLESHRMTDADDGGGRMTGNVIADGASNNIFPDISELDRTYGRVNLRKVFPAVLTPTVDTYYGAHMIVERPPTDPAVTALLFTTGDWNDERAAARNHIERYVVAGPVGPWFLYDVQVVGQRQILLFARPGGELPEVGDVLFLIEDEGGAGEFSQYVRIIEVSSEVRAFTGSNGGEFRREIITCQLTDPLRDTYHGAVITPYDDITPAARVRTTLVADASKYYGARALAAAAFTGELTVSAAGAYGRLVPSARSESPVADFQAGGAAVQTITSGGTDFAIPGPAHTEMIAVEVNNRAYTYVCNLQPIPAPGVATVDYRALGRWYRIGDQGDGTLTGPAGGAGTLDYTTGTLTLTLGALPDVGSAVIVTWASRVHYTDRAGTAELEMPVLEHALGEPVVPGSLTVTWLRGGAQYTATAAVDGAIQGDGLDGRLVAATGDVYIEFTQLPDHNSQIRFDYDTAVAQSATLDQCTPSFPQSGQVAFTLPSHLPARPGSVRVEWTVLESTVTPGSRCVPTYIWAPKPGGGVVAVESGCRTAPDPQYGSRECDHVVIDDGAGALGDGGTVDYATGDCLLVYGVPYDSVRWDQRTGAWVTESRTGALVGGTGAMTARWVEDSAAPTARSVTLTLPPLRIRFLPLLADHLVPGTVRFRIGAVAYSDRAGQGLLYWDDGTVAGSIDYEQRAATITHHTGGESVVVDSLVSTFGQWCDYNFTYRTPGSPLQPGSLIQTATALDGVMLSETTDFSGVIASATAAGTVDQEMGFVTIRFGALTPDADLTPEQKNEPWYDPADIDQNGDIWVPLFVYPNTVRASMVVYSYLPLDAGVLGLDPVRLPSDGRVPIYRPGDVAVVHHTGQIVENAPSNGQVIDCGRQRLARLRILDDTGAAMAAGDYTADLDAGTVTLDNTAPYTAPLTVHHTVADMAMVSDVQIDGTLTLTRSLTHDYPADETLVSGALIIGDRWARYHNLFDQSTWTGAWSDTLIGSAATATFNDVQYPIGVSNDGAIEERWYCRFLNTTEVEIYGEHVGGLTLTGQNRWPIANDIAPENPATGNPFFTIPAAGWGAGWGAGNVLRFNTQGANHPVWISRSIQQSEPATGSDQFCIQIRGDIDTP